MLVLCLIVRRFFCVFYIEKSYTLNIMTSLVFHFPHLYFFLSFLALPVRC